MTSDRLVRNRIIGGRIVERPPRTTGAPATMMQFPITRQHNVIEKGVIDGLRDVRRYELPKIDHGCDGFPVNVICRVPGMPDRGTVRRWERHNAEFRRMIQRGREFGADTLAAEVVEIADAATPQSLRIARNRIQARKWLVSKIALRRAEFCDTRRRSAQQSRPAERKRRTQKSYGALRTIRITWRSY